MSKSKKDESMSIILSKLDKIESKVDKLDDRLDSVEKVAIKQEENLKEHMRRTAILETKLEPVEKHVERMNGALKFLGILSLVLGIAAAIVKLVGM